MVSASCTSGIGRATVLGIPEGVLRARPLPLRVEPTVSGTADELHTRGIPSLPGSNSVLTLQTAPRRTTAQGSAGVLHTRQRARCKCPLRGCLRLWRALYVPRRTGKRSDDAELHTRELPSVGGPFEGKSPHGAVLWLLNVATGWPLDNRLTACVRIQSVGGPFES